MKRNNNAVCRISGKLYGSIYLGLFLILAALEIYNIKYNYPKGLIICLGFVSIIFFIQFLRLFFYSFECDNKIITIKKLFKKYTFTKESVKSVYSVDIVGTVIEHDKTKTIIPTGKNTLYEELRCYNMYFSNKILFAQARKRGHIVVKPKWYALIFRGVVLYFAVDMLWWLLQNLSDTQLDIGVVVYSFFVIVLGLLGVWWFNRSFVYINEEYIWQGLVFPRKKHRWDEFSYFKEYRYLDFIDVIYLCYKDKKGVCMPISVENRVLNKEDLYFMLNSNGIYIKSDI